MKKIIQLEGLDCAGCAAELENRIAKIEGVLSASVAFVNQRLTVEYEKEETLERIFAIANSFEEVHVVDNEHAHNHTHSHTHNHAHGHHHKHLHAHHETCSCGCCDDMEEVNANEHKHIIGDKENRLKEWLSIGISAVFFLIGILFAQFSNGTFGEVAKYVAYAIAYISVGYPVLISTVKNITKGRIFDENFLMTLASIGAMCIGEVGEAVLVMLLYQIGELLQAIAVGSSRRSLTKLMELKNERATLLVGNEQKIVESEEVKPGDVLLVKAGEKVAVDGILLSDEAILDTKSLTGESEHRTYKKGDEILSGCINVGGMYEMKALRPYNESAVGRILEMVENAASSKAEPEKFITKFAKYYTPIVCCLALAITIFLPLISGLAVDGRFYFKDFSRWLHTALTFLVISCPCALIISVPLTYFSGIGSCAKKGVLVKGSMFLDVLTQAKIIAFDKTGTLTEGNFTICAKYAEGVSEEELLELVTAAEGGSAHPIAKALMGKESDLKATKVSEFAGRGVRAEVNGNVILVGNAVLFKEQAVEHPDFDSPYTHIYVAKNGTYCGTLEIGDRVRAEAKATVCTLKKLGYTRTMMLTGDSEPRSYKVAHETGVQEVYATLLPDQKLQFVRELKREGLVVYVGDGINDAPVMTVADCSVSMGQLGSAAVVEASDLVLISDNLCGLAHAVRIAKKTREIVMQNIIFSVVMKAVFMILGLCGVLPLWLAVFADVGVMLLAVLNSFRVRGRK
ncbi:MAG: heavy metal translocating P-type ATPase [Clostridiales bacterium]|nr:heavy metal translocating P-type ATPase [Clostridiales bacterium]